MREPTVSDHVVELHGGRRLAVTALGEQDGRPVVYLHGAIGTPLRGTPELAAAIEHLGVRLLLPQRPGFGRSTPQPGRTLTDHAEDVERLADGFRLGRFGVVGVSAGGPYAVACAHRLGDRLVAAAAVSSLSPWCPPAAVPGLPRRIALALRAIATAPRLTTRVGDELARLVERNPDLLRRAMTLGAPRSDRRHLADGATFGAAADAFVEATAGGVGGLVDDHLVTSRSWGFELSAVRGDVHVWHGMHDTLVPVEHALQLAAALPSCRVALDPDQGHFFFRQRVGAILAGLVEAPSRFASAAVSG